MPDHGVANPAVGFAHKVGIGRILPEKRCKVTAVKVFVPRALRAGQGKDGRVKVEAVHHDVGFDALGNTGASDDERDAGAAFHQGDLAAVKRVIVRNDLGAATLHTTVVGGEDDVGVFNKLVAGPTRVVGLLKVVDESADVVVELFDHRAVEGVGLSFAHPLRSWIVGEFDAELLHVFVEQRLAPRMDGRVNEPGGVIEKEGPVVVLAHKGQGILGDLVEGETVFIEVMRVVCLARGEAGHSVRLHGPAGAEFMARPVEADILRLGKGVVVDGDVPFATVARGVAG